MKKIVINYKFGAPVEITSSGVNDISFVSGFTTKKFKIDADLENGKIELLEVCDERLETHIVTENLSIFDDGKSISKNLEDGIIKPRYTTELGDFATSSNYPMLYKKNYNCFYCLDSYAYNYSYCSKAEYNIENFDENIFKLKDNLEYLLSLSIKYKDRGNTPEYFAYTVDSSDGKQISVAGGREKLRVHAANTNEMLLYSAYHKKIMDVYGLKTTKFEIVNEMFEDNNFTSGRVYKKIPAVKSLSGIDFDLLVGIEEFNLQADDINQFSSYLQFVNFAKSMKKIKIANPGFKSIAVPYSKYGDIDGEEFSPEWSMEERYNHYTLSFFWENVSYVNYAYERDLVEIEHYVEDGVLKKSLRIFIYQGDQAYQHNRCIHVKEFKDILRSINAIYVDKWESTPINDADGNYLEDMYFVNVCDSEDVEINLFIDKENLHTDNIYFDKVITNVGNESVDILSLGLDVFTKDTEITIVNCPEKRDYLPYEVSNGQKIVECDDSYIDYNTVFSIKTDTNGNIYDNTENVLLNILNGATSLNPTTYNMSDFLWKMIFNTNVKNAEDASMIYSGGDTLIAKNSSKLTVSAETLLSSNLKKIDAKNDMLSDIANCLPKTTEHLTVNDTFATYNPFKYGKYAKQILSLDTLIVNKTEEFDLSDIKDKGLLKSNILEKGLNDFLYFSEELTVKPKSNLHSIPFIASKDENDIDVYKKNMHNIDESFINAVRDALLFFEDEFTSSFIDINSVYNRAENAYLSLLKGDNIGIFTVKETVIEPTNLEDNVITPSTGVLIDIVEDENDGSGYFYVDNLDNDQGGVYRVKERCGTVRIIQNDLGLYEFEKLGNYNPDVQTDSNYAHERDENPEDTVDYDITVNDDGSIDIEYVNNSSIIPAFIQIGDDKTFIEGE